MISPRWRKVWRDLWLNKSRTLLVILAITISVFSLGTVLSSYAILSRETTKNYLSTNPASATLQLASSIDDKLLQTVRSYPEIKQVEGRRTIVARVQVGPNEWRPFSLFVISDFNQLNISTFKPESGKWPPADGEVLVERSGLSVIKATTGERIVIKIPGSTTQTLQLVGTVHDPGQAPGWMDGVGYGYITSATLRSWGLAGSATNTSSRDSGLNELKLVVASNPLDQNHIATIAQQTARRLTEQGYKVTQIEIPPPGKHPHQDQMNALLFLIGAFSLLALVLSGVLVASMIAALLFQQIRQIGVMKAIGARTSQIMSIYFGMVLLLAFIALAVGTFAGVLAGQAAAKAAVELLNFTIESDSLPLWVFLLQLVIGLAVPLMVAAYPIYRGSQISVRQAISDYGVGQGSFGTSVIDRLLTRLRGVSRPILISVRNTFRRRGRLVLTLAVLAFSGAIFMAALNVSASWDQTLAKAFKARAYDLDIRLERPVDVQQLLNSSRKVEGISGLETWGYARAVREHSDEGQFEVVRTYPGGTHGGLTVLAPPATTRLVDFELIAGRRLQPNDTEAVVVNQNFLLDERDLKLGDSLALRIDDKVTRWTIVGVVREVGATSTLYANLEAFAEATGTSGRARNLRIVTANQDAAIQRTVSAQLESRLKENGIEVVSSLSTTTLRASFNDHITILLTALSLITALIAIVGGLGLMSTLSVNVLERTREIGVMGAIGATPRHIVQIVVTEGLVIGVLSWGLAVILSLPLSALIATIAGQVGLKSSLDFVITPWGILVWLFGVIILAALASFYPAWRASRLSVRQALAYE